MLLLFLPWPLIVYPDGRVCISILHPPGDDPLNYENRYLALCTWSCVFVDHILQQLRAMEPSTIGRKDPTVGREHARRYGMHGLFQINNVGFFLTEPNDESGANIEASVRPLSLSSPVILTLFFVYLIAENVAHRP